MIGSSEKRDQTEEENGGLKERLRNLDLILQGESNQ